jgi:hypothetical protein
MADLMIGKTSDGKKLPVLIDSTGKLQIGGIALDSLTVNTDQIESKQDVTNAILTTTAADVATVKGYTQVTKGSGVVDSNTQRVTLATDGPEVTNSTAIKNNTATIATNTTGVATAANQATANSSLASIVTNTGKVPGFSLPAYDYISCSYTGSNLTGVVYKTGGSSGTTVATLTLGYDGSNNLTSVTKS